MIYEDLTRQQQKEFLEGVGILVFNSDSLYLYLVDLMTKANTPLEPAPNISKTTTPDGEEIKY